MADQARDRRYDARKLAVWTSESTASADQESISDSTTGGYVMTAEYILRASLCKHPSCFRSWIKGQGYIGTGSGIGADTREEFWRQYQRTAQSEIENMGYAHAYAEPGYEQPKRGVLFANWNNLARKVGDILERAGYACEWSDEWSTCGDCGKAVRTEPDSYGWTPGYAIVDGDYLCKACAPEEGEEEED